MFNENFVFGVSTAAYQIEGAYDSDGKGKSIWDVFCEKKGKIKHGANGNIACDFYNKYEEDIQLMSDLGVKAYRFSIAWPRILPNGVGEINKKGIDFYNKVIDLLKEKGIEPYITLYHWDLPYELYKKGGWLNDDSSDWFAEYAKVVVENFSDRVENFITFNEPQCFIGLGYVEGTQAPGLKIDLNESIPMAHNVLLAHGKAVKVMRQYAKRDIKIGYAPTGTYGYPASNSPEDIEAARKYSFAMPENDDRWFWNVTWWSDPVFLGTYPKDGLDKYEKYLPATWKEDMKIISEPIDFCGQNLYNGTEIAADEKGDYYEVKRYNGFPINSLTWSITPEAIKWCSKFLCDRYKHPLIITENGMTCHDMISLDGKVHDYNRIDFIQKYLLAIEEAIDEGADVRGYFVWSIMDNFEWAEGYSARFGLVYVDYRTQKRIIKDSGYWYKKVMESNGKSLREGISFENK